MSLPGRSFAHLSARTYLITNRLADSATPTQCCAFLLGVCMYCKEVDELFHFMCHGKHKAPGSTAGMLLQVVMSPPASPQII